jgi:hypothetical protein
MGKKDAVEKLTIEKVRYILGFDDDFCILSFWQARKPLIDLRG